MKRYFLAGFLAACLMVQMVSAADLAGLLYKASGNVEVLAGGGATWKSVKIGMGLSAQDQIRTGEGASAQILLQDGSFYVIKEKCALEILELTYDRKIKAIGSSFKIHKGKFLGRVSKLLSGSRTSFKTPTALVAVRGTELSMDVAESGDTEVYLSEGRIVVTDFVEERALSEDQGELLLNLLHELSLKKGQAVRITSKGITRDKKTQAQLKSAENEFSELRSEGDAAVQQVSVIGLDESQARRKKAREEALQ